MILLKKAFLEQLGLHISPNMILISKILKTKVWKYWLKIANTSDWIEKTDCSTKIIETESKIPDITGLFRNTDCKAKITDIENKIPDAASSITKT